MTHSPNVQGLARSPRQQTFYSKEYALNFPVTSKQPVSEGMKDVTMGVLCTQGSDALVYRGRWRKKAVAVKARLCSTRPPERKCFESSPHESSVTEIQ